MRKLVKPAGRFCVDIFSGAKCLRFFVVIGSMVDLNYEATDGAAKGS